MSDLRYAVRSLRRTPLFTSIVVVTLALGIGANTAVFSAVDAVLLRPLPFPEADRLMRLAQRQERSGETKIAPIRVEDWHRLSTTFEAITGYYTEDISETSGDLPERVRRAWVAPRFLDVWQIYPALGRGFTESEHKSGGPTAVLISDRYWRIRLGGDANVIGRAIRVGSVSVPIVGVMPATFLFPDRTVDLWFPVIGDTRAAQSRQATWYVGVGRLKAGVTPEQARANLVAVQSELARQYPQTDDGIAVELAPLKEAMITNVGQSLWLLFGGVSVLLLITCTNIAGLLLSRATERQHEISVRLSLGAPRLAVAAQTLTETVVLALTGAAVGVVVAIAAVRALQSMAAELPRIDEMAIDWRILLYTLSSAVLVAMLCSILPALRACRNQVTDALKESARTQVSARHPLQWLLVGAQVALSVTLLAGAALLVRSLQELSRVDAGFDASRVLTLRISGNFAETANYERMTARIDTAIEALSGLPGVEHVATSSHLPGVPRAYESSFALAGGSDEERRLVAQSRFVSPEYFATLRIGLVEGTLCRRQPRGAMRDVMVNRSFAARYLSERPSPIGLHLIDGEDSVRVIKGVVEDARELGLARDPVPTVYSCISAPNPTPYVLLRTSGEPMNVAQSARLKIRELEPLRSVYDVAPLEDRIDGAYAQNRLRAALLAFFAATALLLACIGLYGTLSYIVNLRRREIGLRLALGATRHGIVRQFLQQALRTVGVACIAGVLLSFAFTRLLAGMLFGVSPVDPFVLAFVVAAVITVATLAALIPATRAALVGPMAALRDD